MKALIDTCVVVDALQSRTPFEKDAQSIFLAAANNAFTGCITAKAVTDIYYLTHRYTHSGKESREVLRTCLHKLLHVSFRQILPMTASKFLEIRKYSCGIFPCPRQNLLENPRTDLVKTAS